MEMKWSLLKWHFLSSLANSTSSATSDAFVVVSSLSSLNPEQRKRALFEAAKTGNNMLIINLMSKHCRKLTKSKTSKSYMCTSTVKPLVHVLQIFLTVLMSSSCTIICDVWFLHVFAYRCVFAILL